MKSNVYTIPCGDYFDLNDAKACYLVFSPLRNKFTLVDSQTAKRVREGKCLVDFIPSSWPVASPPSPEPFGMMFLLNERCNFSCSYCYSAESRSGVEMSEDMLLKGIEALHESAARNGRNKATVTFIGGGEPMLSWNLIQRAVLMSEGLGKTSGAVMRYVLVTNGSLFDEEKIKFCQDNQFEVQVSFEVLQEVQNAQRGHYEIVSENIKRLCEAGVSVAIRSTITFANVDRIHEMCAECLKSYPLVGRLACEPVADAGLFKNRAVMRDFADRYYMSFKAAREMCNGRRLEISSSLSRTWRGFRMRFCGPLFALTPDGTLTGCSHFSSAGSSGYNHFVFGGIDGSGIYVHRDKFNQLFDKAMAETCHDCWARWNCGGGCPNHRYIYSEEVFAEICSFRKRLLKFELLNELARQYENKTKRSFRSDMIARLGSRTRVLPMASKGSYTQFSTLYILPNLACNFNCTYCYSADGRSDARLNPNALTKFLTYFLSKDRAGGCQRRIVFLGGGEPLLSWDLVRDAIVEAECLAKKENLKLSFSIITNLSLLDEDKISFLKRHNIKVKGSFDILEAVQSRYRGHHELVSGGLSLLLEKGVRTEIQATVMPEAVDTLPDMVLEVARKYPRVEGVVFELVRGRDVFLSVGDVDSYLDKFYLAWSRAREIAQERGVKIFNSLVAACDVERTMYCGGLFVLFPSGDISLCMHTGIPSSPEYGARVFGHVDERGVVFDNEKFKELYIDGNCLEKKCRGCWARRHCAGGCPNAKAMYSEQILDAFCRGMRRIIAREWALKYRGMEDGE